MYSSVEVLRVLPLNGIAPVGRGGKTGQQAVYWSGMKRKTWEPKCFSRVNQAEQPDGQESGFGPCEPILGACFCLQSGSERCLSASARRGKPGSPSIWHTDSDTVRTGVVFANLRKSSLRSRTGKNELLSHAAAPRKPPASKTSCPTDDRYPYGFFLLLLPACRHCLGIPPASPGRRRRTGHRTSNIVIFITVLQSTPPTSPCFCHKTKTMISPTRRLPARSRRRHCKRQSLRKIA
jgi:hypothetical protein